VAPWQFIAGHFLNEIGVLCLEIVVFAYLLTAGAFKKLKTFILREIARFDGPIIRSHLHQEYLNRNFRKIATGESRCLRMFFRDSSTFNCCLLLRLEKLRNSKEWSKYIFGSFILLYLIFGVFELLSVRILSADMMAAKSFKNSDRYLVLITKADGFATEMFRYSTSLLSL
jgi:hypothetical protein